MTQLAPRLSFSSIRSLLESDEFYCDVCCVSTVPHFYRRLLAHQSVGLLIAYLRQNPVHVRVVLEYARAIGLDVHGEHRSERDAALCACVVALSFVADPEVEQFLRWLRRTRLLGLAWAADVADYSFSIGTEVTERNWTPLGYRFSPEPERARLSGASSHTVTPSVPRVYDTENSTTHPVHLAA